SAGRASRQRTCAAAATGAAVAAAGGLLPAAAGLLPAARLLLPAARLQPAGGGSSDTARFTVDAGADADGGARSVNARRRPVPCPQRPHAKRSWAAGVRRRRQGRSAETLLLGVARPRRTSSARRCPPSVLAPASACSRYSSPSARTSAPPPSPALLRLW